MDAAKQVLITGAAQGIGAAVCQRFLEGGWNVTGWDVKHIDDTRITSKVVDVSDPSAVRAGLEGADRLDAVINCAAVAPLAPILDLSDEAWDRTLSINLSGAFYLSKAAFPALKEARGTLVHLASVNSKNTSRFRAPYNASKAGLVALTQALAVEWGLEQSGIRVFAVSPGLTLTEQPMMRIETGDIDEGTLLGRVPLGRWIQPSEIAGAVHSLTTGEFSALHGANIMIDAGFDAWGSHL